MAGTKTSSDAYLPLIRLHILHHAAKDELFGFGMIQELRRHGYDVSPGTLYPILHRMEREKLLTSKQDLVDGRYRRVYRATAAGRRSLEQGKRRVQELFAELFEAKKH